MKGPFAHVICTCQREEHGIESIGIKHNSLTETCVHGALEEVCPRQEW